MINLSIIIPVYKESRNIQKLTKDITNYIDIKNYEILFIDDNSLSMLSYLYSKSAFSSGSVTLSNS